MGEVNIVVKLRLGARLDCRSQYVELLVPAKGNTECLDSQAIRRVRQGSGVCSCFPYLFKFGAFVHLAADQIPCSSHKALAIQGAYVGRRRKLEQKTHEPFVAGGAPVAVHLREVQGQAVVDQ